DRRLVRERHRHPGRLGERALPAGHVDAGVPARSTPVLRPVRRRVLHHQVRVVRDGRDADRLLPRRYDDGRRSGGGALDGAGGGQQRDDDPGAGRVLGGRTAMSIVLSGVRKSFGERVILDSLDLTVEDGETLVVIGASGSGKAVMLTSIVRLREIEGVTNSVDGQHVAQPVSYALPTLARH